MSWLDRLKTDMHIYGMNREMATDSLTSLSPQHSVSLSPRTCTSIPVFPVWRPVVSPSRQPLPGPAQIQCPPVVPAASTERQLKSGVNWGISGENENAKISKLVAEGVDSNPGSLDYESGILPLSYGTPLKDL